MQTLLVIGARGLGSEIARYFAAKKWRVLCAARTKVHSESLAERVTALGGLGVPVVCDVTVPSSLAPLAGEAIDLCVLAQTSGVRFGSRPFIDIDREELDRAFHAMIGGSWNVLKAVGPKMLAAQRGTVLQIGTSSGVRSKEGFAGSGAVHAGLRSLIQVVAKEWRAGGVHVAYLPIDGQIESEDARAWLEKHGTDRALPPLAIAEACEYLHSQPRRAFTHELVLRPFAGDWSAPT